MYGASNTKSANFSAARRHWRHKEVACVMTMMTTTMMKLLVTGALKHQHLSHRNNVEPRFF